MPDLFEIIPRQTVLLCARKGSNKYKKKSAQSYNQTFDEFCKIGKVNEKLYEIFYVIQIIRRA